ncbi:MAG TPA: histidine phosphatase family protein [Alphaproteobacteria bacterium]|nr:histidine phosphatase family protein [Alphaproteobacteria bacterium]
MRRLLLLRHAKSDWSKPGGRQRDDHERPLNARGQEAAALIGRYMRKKKYLPALVLCSTATRTRETLKILLPALGARPEIRYEDSLYLAEWPRLLEAVRVAPDGASPVLMIGHNPGMEQLAAALLAQPKTAAARALTGAMAQKFPTGALAVFDFRGETWSAVKPGAGRLRDFVRPKELAAETKQAKG